MYSLPKNFIFGIAESDLQTVGSKYPQDNENASSTMWDIFSASLHKDMPTNGSFKIGNEIRDIDSMQELGIKGYRTSFSMTRTIDKNGNVNKKAISWYRKYLEQIKKRNIELHGCLYHWDAPESVSKLGILDPSFPDLLLRHVDIVLENFSDVVDYFIPMNELWCIAFLSYYVGIHAPGEKSTKRFFEAYTKSIELQTQIIHKIKKHSQNNKIGLVNIHFPTYIRTEHSPDASYREAREVGNFITNTMYIDPFYMGKLDEEIVIKFEKSLPKSYKEIVANAKCGSDISYYGINYYASQYVKPSNSDLLYEQDVDDVCLKNSLGWPIGISPYYPNGLTDILVEFTQKYRYHGLKQIYISENGTPAFTAFQQEGIPADDFRIWFINQHVKQVEDAIAKGASVKGYFLWSLVDNFEWQEGYKPESAFGLIQLDLQTGKRVPKKSYYWLKQILTDFYS